MLTLGLRRAQRAAAPTPCRWPRPSKRDARGSGAHGSRRACPGSRDACASRGASGRPCRGRSGSRAVTPIFFSRLPLNTPLAFREKNGPELATSLPPALYLRRLTRRVSLRLQPLEAAISARGRTARHLLPSVQVLAALLARRPLRRPRPATLRRRLLEDLLPVLAVVRLRLGALARQARRLDAG
jgi:hypothetical protein